MSDRWTCPACEEQFRLLSELIEHVNVLHPQDERTLRIVREFQEAAG